MNDKFQPLDRDDDVLWFYTNNTFTVGKLKQVVIKQFEEKFLKGYQYEFRRVSEYRVDIKSDISTIPYDDGYVMRSREIIWKGEGKDCKLLKVGFGGWQEGIVRVQAKIVNSYCENDDKTKYNKPVIDICVEFCPDRPNEPISPLDDIRQSEEYKKLSDNK